MNLPERLLESPPEAVDRNHSSPSWLGSVRTVGLLTLLSRVLGLIRDMGMAAVFGNGPLLDSFTLAFRIPNLTRRLFGEGALTTAFLPEFVKANHHDSLKARRLASAVFLLLFLLLVGLVGLGELVVLWNLSSVEVGTAGYQIRVMTAFMLPYVILICLSAQLGAVLNALGEFAIPAFVPVLLNVVWIAALWWIVPNFPQDWDKIVIVMLAVLLGGAAQLIVPWMYLRNRGMSFDSQWKSELPGTRRVFRLMLPVVLAMSVSQLNAICDSSLAWWYSQPEQGAWVPAGMASALYFGQRMYQFPLGVFGLALGTVMFARLAHHVQSGERDRIRGDVIEGVRLVLVIGLPASLGMMLLAEPLTRTLLERGEFSEADSRQTAATVLAYGSAIWAYLGVSLIQRVFYALEDASTPVRVGFVAVALNLVLNFVFLFLIGGSGLAYATAVSAVVQFLLLISLLHWRMEITLDTSVVTFSLKLLFATGLMGAGCLASLWSIRGVWPTAPQWMLLLVPLLVATLLYGLVLKLLRLPELGLLLQIRPASRNS